MSQNNDQKNQQKSVPREDDKRLRPWTPHKFLPYLDEYQCAMLHTYKYKGGDNGYLYRYFYNPAALKLVQYLPKRLAPNVITMIGFFFSMLPFVLLFTIGGTHFQNQKGMDIPRWFYIVEALCYFIYRMLDEMDGKQARRTGNSSPLGLLFDHGLDSFTMGFQAMVMTKCCQVGDGMMAILAVAAPCASFHFSTLEEYYTGGLFLPAFNGVTDGSLAVYLTFILMTIVGNDFWKWPIANQGTTSEILLVDMLVFVNVIIQIVIVLNCLKNIFEQKRKELEPGEITGEELHFKDLVVQIVGYFMPMVALSLLVLMGQEPIIKYISPNSKLSPLFYLILLQCLLMAHVTISMQVNHITKTNYSPFKSRLLLFQLISVFFVYLTHLFAMNKFSTQFYTDVILTLFSLQVIFQFHYVLKIIKEVSYGLKIRIFCVKDELPDSSDTHKLASTTGLEKDSKIKGSSSGSKIAAKRLNKDKLQESSGEHSIDGLEGLVQPGDMHDQDDDGSSKLIQ